VFQFNESKTPYYFVALAFLALALVICRAISRSRMGYYFRAIKESHELAMVLGISFVRWRLAAIMIAAFIAAACGTLYAQYVLYIDAESVLVLPVSVQVVLVTMLGGAGWLFGPVIGAAVLVPLSEITRAQLGARGTGVDMILYGALITLISVYQPKGIWGFFAGALPRRKPAAAPVAPPAPRVAT
jgi:branched-chain amino acid transport system permease protein